MNCKHRGICGSCTLFEMSYDEQFARKVQKIKEDFKELYTGGYDLYRSKPYHFRNRAEFRVWHEGEDIYYAMNSFDKKTLPIEECLIVEDKISETMPILLKMIKSSKLLKERLFAIEFLCADTLLVSLIYHKKIDEEWKKEATRLSKELKISVVGRSRGVKIVVERDFVFQTIDIDDKSYTYKVYENSFLQPNTFQNKNMISWVKNSSEEFGEDLLELYCGHGNFTIPLSEYFKKVLATEISKRSIKAAKENTIINDRNNISFVRLSSEELTQAMNGSRIFRRLEGMDLKSYLFSTVFVDPPRAGVDENSLKLIERFENIIYISCNPKTLKRDLSELGKAYTIEKFALFDQFPYTEHIECGTILKKRKS